MPNAKNNAKLTGDTHLPDVGEDMGEDLPELAPEAVGSEGTARDDARSSDRASESRPGKDINQAGFIKDKEAPERGKDGA